MGNNIPPHKAMVIGIHEELDPCLNKLGSIQIDTSGASTLGTEKNARNMENIPIIRNEKRLVRSNKSAFAI